MYIFMYSIHTYIHTYIIYIIHILNRHGLYILYYTYILHEIIYVGGEGFDDSEQGRGAERRANTPRFVVY